MKAQILLLILLFTIGQGWAKKTDDNNPILGSWKYIRQSEKNDFQQVLNTAQGLIYTSEYFLFENNNKFKHEFINRKGVIVRTLTGKWKSNGEQIMIDYSTINYKVDVSYFFLDKDLVLGQNFSHVIFTKEQDHSGGAVALQIPL